MSADVIVMDTRDDSELLELLAERVTILRLAINEALAELRYGDTRGVRRARAILASAADPPNRPLDVHVQPEDRIGSAEAAELLGISPQALQVWAKRGKVQWWPDKRGLRTYDRIEIQKLSQHPK